MFMQAGFLFLELGFSRGKNVGAVVAKILTNFSISSIVWWACGFAIAFGGAGWLAGDSGFFFQYGSTISSGSLVEGTVDGSSAAFFFFQFVFCAVSLAIVWGTTIERIKFIAYPIYAIVFSAIIYPLIAHWIFGGGFLASVGNGVQDFAGSTVVHLSGATGAFAALLLLGPRKGKYGPDGKPRAIPGHSMPIFGLGVLILWLGWFGFNPGSTLGTADGRFAEIVVVTNLAAAAGVIGAMLTSHLMQKTLDVGMIGNGAIAALVAITAPSGYVEFWAAPIIGIIAGILVVVAVIAIDKVLDDPVGALSAHGLAGIWGTLACGLFTSTRLGRLQRHRRSGPVLQRLVHAARRAARRGVLRRSPRCSRCRSSRSARSRPSSASVCPTRTRTPAWTSPSTACTATRSSSSRPPSCRPTVRDRSRQRAESRLLDEPGGPGHMKLVIGIVRHESFEPIRTELLALGFPSLTISEVKGSGRQKGHHREVPRIGGHQLPPSEDQDRVHRRVERRADDRRHDPEARPDRRHRRRQGVRGSGRGGLPRPDGRVRRGSPPGTPGRSGSRRVLGHGERSPGAGGRRGSCRPEGAMPVRAARSSSSSAPCI